MSLWVNDVNPSQATTTIVFLHGMGVSSWMWQEQIAALQDRYHCLAIDLPANGESYQVEWRSMRDSAEQVAALIRQRAATGKVHVVGLSLGGYVALSLLTHCPDVVESVIVSGVTSRPFPRQWLWRAMLNLIAPIMKWEPLIYANASAMHLPADARQLFKRDMKRLNKQAFLRVYDELLNYQLPSELRQRSQRLLAVAGDAEVETIRAALTGFPALMATAQAALVPQAHHGWNGEHPQLFSDMVRCWVENLALPSQLQIVSPMA